VLGLLLLSVVTQTPAKAAVVDISAPDAIYEDVSRALADDVVFALNKAGLIAVRIDEREMPRGCHGGPCLGKVAFAQKAQVVVTVEAEEVDGGASSHVLVTAMRGTDGSPLAGGRYEHVPGGKPPKGLVKFAQAVAKQAPKPAPTPAP
jgi:hypothetical protein